MPGLEWKRLGWMRAASQRGKGEATVACSAWFARNRVLKTKRRKVCSMTGSDLCIAAVVTMMFVAGIALVIRAARHQSMVRKRWGISHG